MEINEIAYLTITVHLIASRHMLFTHSLMWGLPYHEPEWANRQTYGGLELDKWWIIIRQKNGLGVEYWAKVEWGKVDVCRSGQVDSCADQWRNLSLTEQRIQIVANWSEQVSRESKGAENVNWTGFRSAQRSWGSEGLQIGWSLKGWRLSAGGIEVGGVTNFHSSTFRICNLLQCVPYFVVTVANCVVNFGI